MLFTSGSLQDLLGHLVSPGSSVVSQSIKLGFPLEPVAEPLFALEGFGHLERR